MHLSRFHLPAALAILVALAAFSTAAQRNFGISKRPDFKAYQGNVFPKEAPILAGAWSVQPAFPGLSFQNPMGLTAVPGTNDLLVWEREGRLWRFAHDPATTEKRLVIDLSEECQGWHDSGLLGVAPHPAFAENHYLFVYYTAVPPGQVGGSAERQPATEMPNRDRLVRYTCDPGGSADPASAMVLIDQIAETVWHEGGGLFFGPKDGFLYLSVGDDARAGKNQKLDGGFFSGVLRIDVDCRGGEISHPPVRKPLPEGSVAEHYFIPNANPFVGQPDVLEEFFALGLRNPHRMTADPVTGRIFIGDVGEGAHEELNVIEPTDPPGVNFQWNLQEGAPTKAVKVPIGVSKGPLLSYRHLEGRAIIAGYVYRGKEFARDLGGKFIFGDNVTGTVWYLDESTTPASKHILCTVPDGPGPNAGANYCGLSSFGVDAQGEIYLCQMSSTAGAILKLSRQGPPPVALPKKLSETKLFASLGKLTPSAALIPYEVNSPLWSDGASKQRWMAIPSTARIGFQASGEWSFPEGSVFVKHFELPKTGADGKPLANTRLETRVLVRDTNGYVYGASYRWRADHSDADLVETGQSVDVVVATGMKGKPDKMQNWFFPGRQDCLTCHTRASGGVLGVNTRQLNRPYRYPSGVTDNQLRTLAAIHLFEGAPEEATLADLGRLAPADDLDEPVEVRARSYLDSNCSHCHRPGGVHAFWDARYETALHETGIVNGLVNNTLGQHGAKVVAPGDWTRSILFKRISVAGQPHSMPPLAKQRVDKTGIGLIAEWIASMDDEEDEPLPGGWHLAEIGSQGGPAQAGWRKGTFYLSAQNHDLWENLDSAIMVHASPMESGQITARVLSLTPTDAWTKAGVILRSETTADAASAIMVVTPGQGSAFQYRETAGAFTQHATGPSVTAPYWVRLAWKDGAVIASRSTNGQTWTETGRALIGFPGPVLPGLCLSGHQSQAVASAGFDQVKIEPYPEN
ncbi:MAG: PQQ-dependent sugar dehydrogenase [Verrucomicrobia bacterium]|nr:PQQ-dependent sugar dehydrogenase [Verrucomicrobiota bacterium]